jgi:peptidoglycan/xylan/chitin deacetylase (PgdA/CDA1 family)
VEVGAHSATHCDLRRCSDEELQHEVSGARGQLLARFGQVDAFSYPFGRHDARVREAVGRAGYALGCSSRYGANRDPARLALERIEIAGTDDLTDFAWKLEGKYDWVGLWQDLTPER